MYAQAKRIRPIRVFTTNVRCFYDTFLVKIATNRGLTSNIFYCIILALLYSSKSTTLNIIYSNFYRVFIEWTGLDNEIWDIYWMLYCFSSCGMWISRWQSCFFFLYYSVTIIMVMLNLLIEEIVITKRTDDDST